MSNTPEFRHVLVLDDQKSRRSITLEESSYVIGRDPSSPIVLNDRQVSRHHATLIRVIDYATNQFSYRLIDGNLQGQKSSNGLLVNGKKIYSHGLKPGDFIQFSSSSRASYYIVDADAVLASLPLNETLSTSPVRPQSSLLSPATEISPGIISTQNQPQTSPLQTSSYNVSNPHFFALSSTEYSPFPIFELDFSGQLTYLNLAAKQSFPDLSPATRNHPLLHHLLDLIDSSHLPETTRSVRTIQINNSYFEQHIHYFTENKLIRCYVIDNSRYHRLKWR
jgi:pSer/pThr/pTyr-binding forkhead associated (FHA) protein